jgi:hypothetical protein
MYSEYTASHAEHQALLAIGAVSHPYRMKTLKILSENPDGLPYATWCVLTGKNPYKDAGMFVYNLRKLEEGRLVEKNSIGRYEVTFLGKSVLDFQRHLERYLESMEGKEIPVISRETSLAQKLEEPKIIIDVKTESLPSPTQNAEEPKTIIYVAPKIMTDVALKSPTLLPQKLEEPQKLDTVIKLPVIQNIILKVLSAHEDFGLRSRYIKMDVEETIRDRLEEAEIRHGLFMLRREGYTCHDGNRNVLTKKGREYIEKIYPKNSSA